MKPRKQTEEQRLAALARAKKWYQENKTEKKAYDREYNSRPHVRAKKNKQSKEWVENNKEKRSLVSKAYYNDHKDVAFRSAANRRGRVKQATPKWLTFNQRQDIAVFYALRPQGYHVDHIIPLVGDNVCGLHVPWNLQYLLPEENLRKGVKCA